MAIEILVGGSGFESEAGSGSRNSPVQLSGLTDVLMALTDMASNNIMGGAVGLLFVCVVTKRRSRIAKKMIECISTAQQQDCHLRLADRCFLVPACCANGRGRSDGP